MRYWGILITFGVMLEALGCAGSSTLPNQQQPAMQPIAGAASINTEFDSGGQSMRLHVAKLGSDGEYFRLELPEGKTVASEIWQSDSDYLHLVVPYGGSAEVGIMPLKSYSGHPISAELALGPAPKAVQSPPEGARAEVQDLTVAYSRPGYVRLSWTEVNNGDYDLNGYVYVNDLQRIGAHFNEHYDVTAPDAQLNPLYWIDGNHDGWINQADITNIGANFNSTIGGYTVLRDGDVVLDPLAFLPTCKRDSEFYVTQRSGLPPFYSIELVGYLDDQWQVVPVDKDFGAGPNPETNLSDGSVVDLASNISIDGAQLLNMSSEISSGLSGSNEMLRVIEPGHIVDSYEIGDRLALPAQGTPNFFSSGRARFSGVPRGEALLLEAIYAPAVDLVTGAPKTGPATLDDVVITAIPFRLPDLPQMGTPAVVDVDAQIELEEKPGGGYYVIVHTALTTRDTANSHDTVNDSTTRLDYATGELSRLSESDDTYDTVPELTDQDRDGISESHLEELLEYDAYSAYWNIGVKVTGTLAGYNEGSGIIQLDDAVQTAGSIDLGDIEVRFSELTQFGEIEPGGNYQSPDPVDPSDLQIGDDLVLGVYIYNDTPQKYWALTVVRQLP